jgi:hypothetical protein
MKATADDDLAGVTGVVQQLVLPQAVGPEGVEDVIGGGSPGRVEGDPGELRLRQAGEFGGALHRGLHAFGSGRS